MVYALTFTGNIDPTALATFLLAAITLVTVVVGGRALGKTTEEIDLSRREVEEAHRPVIVPLLDDAQKMILMFDDITERRARPYYLQNNRLVVPIKNIGSGPALNISVDVTPVNDDGQQSTAWGDKNYTLVVSGLGVGEVIPAVVPIPGLGDVPSFRLRVMYTDVAQKAWVTLANYYNLGGGSYASVSIVPHAEDEYSDPGKEREIGTEGPASSWLTSA
jgi:hypothetical protein